MNSIQVS